MTALPVPPTGEPEAHEQLLVEMHRRLDGIRDDPAVVNADGSNYWGPYVTRAVDRHANDGPALVRYVKRVLRKTGQSEGWSALLEARRLDRSFEDMVVNAEEPISTLFTDEDRALAGQSLAAQRGEIERRVEAAEAAGLEQDLRTVSNVAARRRAAGKPWTDEIEQRMLAGLVARRRATTN